MAHHGQHQQAVIDIAGHEKPLQLIAQWLRPGLNSISLVLSNPDNLPYHWQGRAVQTTFLVDARSDSMVKNRYLWPG